MQKKLVSSTIAAGVAISAAMAVSAAPKPNAAIGLDNPLDEHTASKPRLAWTLAGTILMEMTFLLVIPSTVATWKWMPIFSMAAKLARSLSRVQKPRSWTSI